ncbi:protein PET100 homolog, mitochondrial isoform 5-T5 [Dama dama]|uniref:protein PET100 homolog, mitochondrial isoform X5 n=1 Tax=Dama dama TaxID=30532 RepID=UPI002A36F9E8|nr:protein PET100 homolog, mitochondrial isoform X5 [Dama dama]
MGVKLEVFRMTIYLTFPVAMFWIANQAEWFEDYVIQRKRELWPPEKEDQGIFPTQGLNPGLSHCRRILYQLSHKGSPRILDAES